MNNNLKVDSPQPAAGAGTGPFNLFSDTDSFVNPFEGNIGLSQLLNGYIHDLTKSGQLSKHNIDDAKYEQGKILHEVKSIKKGLDAIINNTNYISSELEGKK